MKIEIGSIHSIEYPFVLEDYTLCEDEGPFTCKTWRPGVRYEQVDNFGGVDTKIDGKGKMRLTVVDIHKPGKFPKRIFFTRQWEGPEGVKFGKGKLHITTEQHFKRLVAGYRYWDEIAE
ncbi:MAG: hypothetical protein A2Y38_00535 [Spirochaetes bacterium GWB1_59_5]|nr:MAG: hypothetical protein A2Y38_00535 [Spirochaetes bacterium GWB1_59_5]